MGGVLRNSDLHVPVEANGVMVRKHGTRESVYEKTRRNKVLEGDIGAVSPPSSGSEDYLAGAGQVSSRPAARRKAARRTAARPVSLSGGSTIFQG